MPKGRRKKKNGRGDSRPPADLERTASDEQVASNESPAFGARVGITITPYRIRQIDTDGLSEKAAIDGLVHCGIIRDDSAKEVAWVHKSACVKVKNREDEKTVIIIEEV
jgi:hypothetical protein